MLPSLIPNNSPLPSDVNYIADKRLSAVKFSARDIEKIIQNLDSNKTHGRQYPHAENGWFYLCTARCDKQGLLTGVFPSKWKIGNNVLFNEKDKQNIKNYRAASLLPICGKIFERLIFNKMFFCFSANKLISENQCCFQPGDSCISQLLSITYKVFTSFDNGLEVRTVLLDISKTFDKVWHEGLIFKLKQNSISGELLCILSDFLSNRKHRVVLNSQNLSWSNAHAGGLQQSILDPLLFLIFLNGLLDNFTSNANFFADDTSLQSVVHDVNISAKELNDDLQTFNYWAFQWNMSFICDLSKQIQEVIFSHKSK